MTAVAGGLITLEYAKDGVGWSATSTSRDSTVIAKVQAATPVIEDIVGPVLPRSKVRRFHGGKEGVLLVDEIADETSVTAVLEDEVAITDYWVDPDSRILYAGNRGRARRFRAGKKNIAVTYQVGYSPIPQTLQDAAQALVRHWIQQGIQGPAAPALGGDSGEGMATSPMGFAIPARVMELCQSFISSSGIA